MIGRRDIFFSCPRCFFPYSRFSSYLLRLFLYLISFSLFPCASVCGKTLVHEFPISYRPYWMVPSAAQVERHSIKYNNISSSIPHMFFWIVSVENNFKNRLNCNMFYNHVWHRIGYIVIFKCLFFRNVK